MNKDKQRIAIAEACGWTSFQESEYKPFGKAYTTGFNPKGGENRELLPDYLNDLNAMHEAEKVLRKPIYPTDTDNIIADRMTLYAELLNYSIDATANQRAEAFLRTICRWEDGE